MLNLAILGVVKDQVLLRLQKCLI